MPATWRVVCARLYEAFGPQGWWPARSLWEVVVGCILAQGTSWRNAERAIAGLRAAGLLHPEAVLAAADGVAVAAGSASGPATWTSAHDRLLQVLRPSGHYRQKAERLIGVALEVERHGSLAGWLDSARRLDDDELRSRFLAVRGIGPETADCLLLYAAGRATFVADAYARRIGTRLGLLPPALDYEGARRAALRAWRPTPGAAELAEAHALFVELGKRHCRKRDPRCVSCPLVRVCPTGSAALASARGGGRPAPGGAEAGGRIARAR